MAVCQFYLRGQCKFGDSCRNEHPQQTGGGFGATSWSRPSAAGTGKTDLPFNAANITQDLNPKGEKPLWPLSSYAPFKSETTLIGGLDVSPEELRVRAAAAVTAGNINEYIQYEASQIAAAEQVFTGARNNITQTFEQATKQSRLVPSNSASTSTTSSAFNNAGTSTFGNAATPSSTFAATSTFGEPAFGQAGFNQPAFGQSGFGQTPTSTSAFGQPTTNQPPGGEQTAAPTTTSVFGQPAFGQPNPLASAGAGTGGSSSLIRPASGAFSAFAGAGPSVFGTGASPNLSSSGGGTGGGFSAFAGQPSAFGTAASGRGNAISGFGQPSSQATATTSVFGQSSTFGQQQPSNAFSTLTSSSNVGSVFGSFGAPAPAPATETTTTEPASVFGGGTQGQSVFGNLNTITPQQPAVSAFGQLGQTTSNVSPSGLIPSISMASSNSGGGSVFPVSPMSTINPNPAAAKQPPTSSFLKTIDFASIIPRTTYRPGATPYDSQLPQNYSALLPDRVSKAFGKEKFTWAWQDGEATMPEWTPPVDVR